MRENISKWLPDWMDESAYPNPGPDTFHGKIVWAWEFLRRNPEYQKIYDLYKQTSDTSEKVLLGLEIAQKYGFRFRPVAPSQDDPFTLPPLTTSELSAEERTLLTDTFFNFSSPVRVLNNFSRMWGITSSPVQSDLMTQGLGSNNIVIAFDLGLPPGPQMEIAGKYIEDLRDLLKMKPQEYNFHFGDFKNYLRILDAKLSGATNDEIASKISLKTSGHEDAGQGEIGIQRAYKRAKEIRDKEYKYIIVATDGS
jgi:hypothetical protein